MRCVIFHTNTKHLPTIPIIYRNINIFTRETLYPSVSRKKMNALHCKPFSKHSLFTNFSLFLKMSEVCNISSKCWLPNKVANKIFLRKTPYTPPLFHRKNCALHSGNLLKTSTFYHIFSSFDIVWGCYISYKYEPPNNLEKYQYFYTRDFVSLLHFEKNWRSPSPKFFETSTFYDFFTIFKSEWGL